MFTGHISSSSQSVHDRIYARPLKFALVPLAASVPFASYAIQQLQQDGKKNEEDDDQNEPVQRHRPESLSTVCANTKFSKKEVRILYRAFKQGCPYGTISMTKFQEIYAQFFPHSISTKYAQLVFRTFDRDGDGMISFEARMSRDSPTLIQEFVTGLSVISRGSADEKLEWIFDLYDINRRGRIGQGEMHAVIQSIYELLGRHAEPPISRRAIFDHVLDVFKKMDQNHDGLITREEFVSMCRRDEALCESLHLFDTKL